MDIVVGRRDTMIILHNGFMDLDTHIRFIFKFQQAQCYKKRENVNLRCKKDKKNLSKKTPSNTYKTLKK